MADEAAAFDDYPNKRKHEESEEQERKRGFSASPGERVRKTGFSGPPGELQHERKTGFSAPLSESYERRSGFSGPPSEPFERKSGFAAPIDSERKTGFSGPPEGDFERKTGFSSHPGDVDRKTGFSGPPPSDPDRKSSFSSPPHGDYERKSGFSTGEHERKTGFSGPPAGEQPERKTGFSGPPADLRGGSGNAVEIAKQKAEQIAARLVAQDNKRPRTDDGADDQFAGNTGYPRDDRDRGQMFQDVHYHREDQSGSFYNTHGQYNSKRLDIPNSRVGVVIGKSGETIKGLQARSGARIQITRDADHDPQATTRQVEIMGTPDQIRRAEDMIKDVIAEAEAGGPGQFLGGGFGGSASFGEPIQIRVPTSKVGLIIGRGGETIKSMQNQSGARIQLVPAAMPDYSQERVITLVGTQQQTDMASELIREIIDENRPRGYSQQGFRPPGAPQWGQSRPPMQAQDYGYQQPGSYSGQSQPQPHGGYGQPQSGGGPQQYPQQSQQYGGYNQQRPQQFSGQPQPYGSSQEFSGAAQQYGGFPQRAPSPAQHHGPQGYFNPSHQPGASPTDNHSRYDQQQATYNQQSRYGHQGYGQHGSAVQSPSQSTPNPQPYGQTFPQHQPYGQHTSGQAGFGQQSVPPSSYSQQGYGPQGVLQPSEQNPPVQPAYASGSAQQTQPMQPSYGQQPSNQPLGYGQQAPGFPQQEGVQAGYGQGGSSQPGFPMQATTQQEASTQPGYNQSEVSQGGFGPVGANQSGYSSGAGAQSGYGQVGNVQPGLNTQGAAQNNYAQRGGSLSGYGQQAPYGAQASPAPMYGTPQPGTAVMYGAQGSLPASTPQPSYVQAGAQPTYAQQGPAVGYPHAAGPLNPSYSEGTSPSGKASNGGFDSANVSAGPAGAQPAQS